MYLFISEDLCLISFVINSYSGCLSLVVICCSPNHQSSAAEEGAGPGRAPGALGWNGSGRQEEKFLGTDLLWTLSACSSGVSCSLPTRHTSADLSQCTVPVVFTHVCCECWPCSVRALWDPLNPVLLLLQTAQFVHLPVKFGAPSE